MNPQDPLAALHPLREPGLIGWWPLAPGWWILIVITIGLLAAVALFFYRRYRANAYRRQAMLQLEGLHKDWLSSNDSRSYLTGINALLKSVALRVYPLPDVASSNGDAWVDFLNLTLTAKGGNSGLPKNFASAVYQATVPDLDFDDIHHNASVWIKQHRATP